MRNRSRVQAVWVLALIVGLAALALTLNDPVMEAIMADPDGIGTELAP